MEVMEVELFGSVLKTLNGSRMIIDAALDFGFEVDS